MNFLGSWLRTFPSFTRSVQERLMAHFADPEVVELLVNGVRGCTLIRASGESDQVASICKDPGELMRGVQGFARDQGVRLDPLQPAAGGEWRGAVGAGDIHVRWHCVLPPIAPDGPLVSVRRHRFTTLLVDDFAISPEFRARIDEWLIGRRPLLVCGPTGAGKSTFLAALLGKYAKSERVLILEQIPELPCHELKWARIVARPPNFEGRGEFTLSRALEESLRLRPDRIVVGEVRGVEASALVHAVISGHDGVMATMHAGSVTDACLRLRTLLPAVESVVARFGIIVLARGVPPRVVAMSE